MKAADISDADALAAVRAGMEKMQQEFGVVLGACRSDVQKTLSVCPEKVVLAKLKSMVRRKVLSGCACGCRGDFEPAQEDVDALLKRGRG